MPSPNIAEAEAMPITQTEESLEQQEDSSRGSLQDFKSSQTLDSSNNNSPSQVQTPDSMDSIDSIRLHEMLLNNRHELLLNRLPSMPHGPRIIPSIPSAPIATNELIPSALVRYQGQVIDVAELFRTQLGVVFGVPGAFSPVCTEMHVQGFRDRLSEFQSRGVNLIVCIAVNDPFVIQAWAKSMGLTNEIVFLADSTGALSKKLGLLQDFSSLGMALRCRRCAMIVGPESRVRWIGFESDAFAPSVLKQLDRFTDLLPKALNDDALSMTSEASERASRKSVTKAPETVPEGDEQDGVVLDKEDTVVLNDEKEADIVGDVNVSLSNEEDVSMVEAASTTPPIESPRSIKADVNSFFESAPVSSTSSPAITTTPIAMSPEELASAVEIKVGVIPEPIPCIPSDVIAELEETIKGLPRDTNDDEVAVKYEIKRSQCNLLCDSIEASDSDTNEASSNDESDAEEEREKGLDEDGFDDFSTKYKISHHECYGRTLHDVTSQNGDEAMDIKFGYLVPDQCRFIRRKALKTDSTTNDSVLWDFHIEPRSQSAGYILVDNIKFYAREIHFHSPAIHLLRGSNEARPLEIHITHIPELNTNEMLKRVVVLSLTFVWEPDYDVNNDQSSKLIKNIINTVLGKTFRSDGKPNIVSFTDGAIDLQRFIAENTMAAFYRYTTNSVTDSSPLEVNSIIECPALVTTAQECPIVEEQEEEEEEEAEAKAAVDTIAIKSDDEVHNELKQGDSSSNVELSIIEDKNGSSHNEEGVAIANVPAVDETAKESQSSPSLIPLELTQSPSIETTWIVGREGIPLSWESFQSLRLVLGHSSLQDPSTFSGSVNRVLLQTKNSHYLSNNTSSSNNLLNPPSPHEDNINANKFLTPSMFLFNNSNSSSSSPLKRSSTLAASRKDSNRRNTNQLLSSPTARSSHVINSPVTLVVSSMLR